jgi:2-phospho-L-lactate guanylyltransferase
MVAAVVPLKNLKSAKSRLGGILSEEERQGLVVEMLRDVLKALKDSLPITKIFVVADTPLFDHLGVETIVETKNRGYDEAIIEALNDNRVNRSISMLILPADLPLITSDELGILVTQHSKRGLRIAGARDGDGTNALLMTPPNLLDTKFGKGSFERHKKEAMNNAAPVEVINLPGFAFDVDTEQDLIDFIKIESDTNTYRFLDESGVIDRLINL